MQKKVEWPQPTMRKKPFRQTEFPFDECFVCLFIFRLWPKNREPFTIPLGGKCFRLVYFACLVFCCRFVNKNVHSSATTIFSVIDRHYSQHLVFVSFIVFSFFSRVECPNKSGCRKREWFFFILSALFLYCEMQTLFIKYEARNREAHCRITKQKSLFRKVGKLR